MIEFNNIKKVFKSDLLTQPFVAIDGLSFKIEKGSITGYLGANGAGKTTSLKILMDFIRPTSGEVLLDTKYFKNKNDFFKKLGFLPERPFFYPNLTGREFCYYMGKLSGVSKSKINEQVIKWAPKFAIEFALDREIKTYSKGMLQRVGFLVTLLHDPEIIILDEPLSGLDPIGRKELKDVIRLIRNEGKTIFFSSHIVQDVEEVCDSVIFIKSGKLVYQGSVDDIISENIVLENKVSYELDGQTHIEMIKESEKMNFLNDLIAKNANIISVEKKNPTLEEVFYNVE